MGAAITVNGEVVHPSTYGISEGERLSDVLQRAGGFREDAYPQGAILERVQIREWEEQQRADMVRRLDQEQQTLKAASAKSPAEGAAAQGNFTQQQAYLISKIKDTPTVGRMVIKISGDIDRWKGTPADVQVRAGDVITIPKRPNFVMVSGQVYNPLAVTYRPGKSARWYLGQAGGANDLANKKSIFVVRADGSLVGNGGGLGWWNSDPLNVVLNPGDMVYVPEKFITSNSTLKSLSETAQIISSVALAASVALR
jgi:protein involved in polysaccharide export with SLBB domain